MQVKDDIVQKLRTWCHRAYAEPAFDIMNAAADEIERLEFLRDADGLAVGTLVKECQDMKDRVIGGCPHVTGNATKYCTLTPFKLAEVERDCISEVVDCLAESGYTLSSPTDALFTLRNLLERTK